MYITVKIKKFSTFSSYPNVPADHSNEAPNIIIESFAQDLVHKLMKKSCPIHKNLSKGTVIITTDSKTNLSIEKAGFCCDIFRDSLIIDLN